MWKLHFTSVSPAVRLPLFPCLRRKRAHTHTHRVISPQIALLRCTCECVRCKIDYRFLLFPYTQRERETLPASFYLFLLRQLNFFTFSCLWSLHSAFSLHYHNKLSFLLQSHKKSHNYLEHHNWICFGVMMLNPRQHNSDVHLFAFDPITAQIRSESDYMCAQRQTERWKSAESHR